MNIREMIDKLTDLAEHHLPHGMDSEVRVKVCNGQEDQSLITTRLEIDMITEGVGGPRPHVYAIVDVHPHLDDDLQKLRPEVMGVDDELARLAAGEDIGRAPVAGSAGPIIIQVEEEEGRVALIGLGDGWAVRMPYDETGRLLVPGMPDAVAAGCICNQEQNRAAVAGGGGKGVALRYRRDCPMHRRVPQPPQDGEAHGRP